MSSYRQSPSLALLLLTIAVAAHAPDLAAQDADSLRVTKVPASSEIELSWTDAMPSTYCIGRSMMPTRPLAFLIQTADLFLVDDPPAAELWYYDVTATMGDCIAAAPCVPAGMLACGAGPVAGDTNDPGATDVIDDWSGCGQTGLTGPELAYELRPGFDGQVLVRLSTAVPDLQLYVIEDVGEGCVPGSCVGWTEDELALAVVAGGTYHVVVDGLAGAAGAFDVEVLCAAGCTPEPASLDCGDSVSGASDGLGSTDLVDFYSTCGVTDAAGSERAYTFTAAADGPVTATLDTLVDGLDLFVLEDLGDGCTPGNCFATEDAEVTWTASAGTTYHVVVDGRLDAAGDFTLALSCAGGGCEPAGTLTCDTVVSGNNAAAGSSDVNDAYAACGGADASGPELVYELTPASSGRVDLSLSGLSADLDLFVLREDGAGCAPASCIAGGGDALQFDAVLGRTYYVVVDGIAGAESDFDLSVSCTPAVSACEPAEALICGTPSFGRNDDPGSTDAIDAWPCAPGDYSGPELTYDFQASGTGDVTLSIGSTPDVDLFVLDGSGGACDPAACLAFGSEEVTFPAVAGERYFVVIDGASGGMGPYVLSSTCDFPAGQCTPSRAIACGERNFNNNANPAGSTDVNDSYPCAPGRDMSGPELTYQLSTPPGQDTRVTAILENQTGDVDVFVLENLGWGCDPAGCVAWGDDQVSFDAIAGRQYYLVVDGPNGNVGDFRLRLECTPVPGECLATTPIACGETLTGQSNDQAGSTDAIDVWEACAVLNPPDVSGPEYSYAFTAGADGVVDVVLSNVTNGPLAVYAIEDAGTGCDADQCLGFGFDGYSFMANAGSTYYIVVEGYLGRVSGYDISVSCP